MTDKEFDLLDNLYFITTFPVLVKALNWPEADVLTVLSSVIDQGWAKVVPLQDGDMPIDNAPYQTHPNQYHYLATKAGLFAHNAL